MTIAFIADSTLQINEHFANKYNVTIIPLEVRLDSEVFLDNVTIMPDNFYQAIKQGKKPSTSQPSVGYIVDTLNKLKEQGVTEVIAFSLSSSLSGTYSSFSTASTIVDDIKLTIIDTKEISRMSGYAIENIIQRYYNGQLQLNDISRSYTELSRKQEILLTMTNLDFIFAGGRLTKTQFLVSNLLNILPILTIKDGKIQVKYKCRSLNKTLTTMINDVVKAQPKHIIIFHTTDYPLLDKFEKLLIQTIPSNITIEKIVLSPCLGSHAGPHCVAISHFQY